MKKQTLIPTKLFVGPQNLLDEKTEKLLQETFCANREDNCFCSTCRKIKSNQHESIIWISPEGDYTLKDIEIVFEKVNFALNENEKFFFILQKTNTLNLFCANRLLKILEEPPAGYNFILHTNNINSILPTILSRCHVVDYSLDFGGNLESDNIHPIADFFYNEKLDIPDEFDKELKKVSLTSSQTVEIVDEMIAFYSKKIIFFYKDQIKSDIESIERLKAIVEFLKEKIQKPPAPGSANLFWKNLYISFSLLK